ncbi:zinc finger protein 354A-like isoform X3 [Macrobrachium nipponense]|uniref:zinc finger protein 354A-like isoform X3 n=1 Tax=Macrobrachium nipponense TaxID=159736 RepID=UPI0030C89226
MSSDDKIMEGGGEGSSHDTHQAITCTIHIMAPTDLGTNAIDSALVASVEAQDTRQESDSSLLVVPADGDDAINVSAKNIIQTVTETNIGSVDLPVISNINSDQVSEQSIELITKDEKHVEDIEEDIGCHCLICNEELQEQDNISVFKSFTTTSQRKVSIFLGDLVGQKLTSRKTHSTIICDKCFKLLNKLDLLEFEIQETKEEIITKYQETIAAYGGRARRKKPAAAKKSDYVFPKIEPEEEDKEGIEIEGDEIYQPQVDDLLEEEQDRREDRDSLDEEWEPEVKRARIKKESTADPSGPPKRKRGRPRKDASKTKAELASSKGGVARSKDEDDPLPLFDNPACPVCEASFSFPSQLRRHVRHEHPDFDAQLLPHKSVTFSPKKKVDLMHVEVEEGALTDDQPLIYDLRCSWCDQDHTVKEEYDEHLKEHGEVAFRQYMEALQEAASPKPKKKLNSLAEESDNCSSKENLKNEDRSAVQCNCCGFSCGDEWTLEHHLDMCHKDASRTCGLCNEQCFDAASLHDHLIHHFHGVMVCPVCPIKFSARHHLLSHLKVCHPSGCVIVCSECDKKFETYQMYEVHLMEFHGKGALRVCKICGKGVLVFDYYKHVEEHSASGKSSIDTGSLSCNLCFRKFEFSTQLYQHKYHEHPEAFSFKCDECERRCRTERLLYMHKWGHKYGSHQCPVCRLKFRQVDQLKKHLLAAHPDQEGYSCKYCPLTLKNYATFIAHCKFKHPRESGYNRPVRCKICGESFDHKMQWKYHMRNHYTQELQTCPICGISVKNLEMHMNLHTKSKKFECKFCGAVYHNKASFHFHVKRVHMGNEIRKYLCDTCGKGFLTPADQRIHIARVHQGERNYWCPTCNKGYKSKVSLTYHERLHTGEKPHKCTICGRTFRVPSYLKRHMEHDHRTQYTGVYFKQGRPKSQEARGQMRRPHQQTNERVESVSMGQANGSIPEIVQITVPMEMGEEVVAAVDSVQSVQGRRYNTEQDGFVYVVYEEVNE